MKNILTITSLVAALTLSPVASADPHTNCDDVGNCYTTDICSYGNGYHYCPPGNANGAAPGLYKDGALIHNDQGWWVDMQTGQRWIPGQGLTP